MWFKKKSGTDIYDLIYTKNHDNEIQYSDYSKTWDSGLKVLHGCPLTPRAQKKIAVAYHVYKLLQLLDEYLPLHEFLVYADYEEVEDFIIVKNPAIPKQRVGYASVNVITPLDKRVVIHKHPSSLTSFSSTDNEYINANNDISLLFVDSKIVKAYLRIRLPCGHYGVTEIDDIFYVITDLSAEVEKARNVFEEQKNNIEKYEPYTNYLGYYYGYREIQ